jgi:hypothetical protein
MLLSFLLIGIFLASILLVEENVSVILSIWSKFVAYFLFMHKDQIIVLLYHDKGLQFWSKLSQFIGADGVCVCSHCRWKGMLEIFAFTQSWRELMRSFVLSWPATWWSLRCSLSYITYIDYFADVIHVLAQFVVLSCNWQRLVYRQIWITILWHR